MIVKEGTLWPTGNGAAWRRRLAVRWRRARAFRWVRRRSTAAPYCFWSNECPVVWWTGWSAYRPVRSLSTRFAWRVPRFCPTRWSLQSRCTPSVTKAAVLCTRPRYRPYPSIVDWATRSVRFDGRFCFVSAAGSHDWRCKLQRQFIVIHKAVPIETHKSSKIPYHVHHIKWI